MKIFKVEYGEIGTEIDKQNLVVKHNDLVQKIRLSLTEAEQKTVLYSISKIKPNDKVTDCVHFDIQAYCKACGIDADSGTNYKRVRALVKALRDKSQEVFIDGWYRPVSWFYDYKVNPQDGHVKVLFNPLLEQSLYGLQRDFLQYRLEMSLPLDGKYTVALYEYFKSQLGNTRNTFTFNLGVDKFKEFLGVDKLKTYENFGKLRMKIIEPAFKDIEEKTDIFIQWRPIKTGRGGKILVIRFDVTKKNIDVMDGKKGIEDYAN